MNIWIDNKTIPFTDWMKALDRHCEKIGLGAYGSDTGAESWEDYYNDGYNPIDALLNEMSCWDD
jgi:hypothetical protein